MPLPAPQHHSTVQDRLERHGIITELKLPLGASRCQCGDCGRYFTSTAAFDKHRVDFVCRHPGKMRHRSGKHRGRAVFHRRQVEREGRMFDVYALADHTGRFR